MATPITDQAGLISDLVALFSNPKYKSSIDQLLARKNIYKYAEWERKQKREALKDPNYQKQPFHAYVAQTLAKTAVESAFGTANKPCLVDPIFVAALLPTSTDICLFRLHDGGSATHSAGTLGGWWCNRRLMLQIWYATSDLNGEPRRLEVMKYMRSAMFIPTKGNQGKQIAQMRIRPGYCVPAIIGRGSWEALKTDPEGPVDPKKQSVISPEAEVMALGMMPIPGYKQFYVPLFDDAWVTDVTYTLEESLR